MHTAQDRKDGWTLQDDNKLIELRSIGMPWKSIADRIGSRTPNGCSSRYSKLVPVEYRIRFHNTGIRWTAEEEARLLVLVAEGRRPQEIAIILGKHVKSVYHKTQYVKHPWISVAIEPEPRPWTPPHLIEDRDRRMKAERTLTAMLCGDPRPGQSALDKKQGAFA